MQMIITLSLCGHLRGKKAIIFKSYSENPLEPPIHFFGSHYVTPRSLPSKTLSSISEISSLFHLERLDSVGNMYNV